MCAKEFLEMLDLLCPMPEYERPVRLTTQMEYLPNPPEEIYLEMAEI